MPDSLATLPAHRGARLRLEALVPDDAVALRSLSDDPLILAAIPFLAEPLTLASVRALIGRNAGGADRFLGVWTAEGRALVGVVGLHLRGCRDLEIGYWIGRDFRGRGYALEAVAAALELAAAALPRRRPVAECRPENRASWRVLERLGFRPTGEPATRPGRRLLARASAVSPR